MSVMRLNRHVKNRGLEAKRLGSQLGSETLRDSIIILFLNVGLYRVEVLGLEIYPKIPL